MRGVVVLLTNEGIREWVTAYIECFRAQMASMGPAERKLSNLDDFSAPTQVLVVSMVAPAGGPEFAVLLGLHLASQPDGSVWVVGPIPPDEVPAEMEAFLAEDLWGEEVGADVPFFFPEGARSLRFVVAGQVAGGLDQLDRQILNAAYGGRVRSSVGSKTLVLNGFSWQLHGDFTSLEVEDLVEASSTPIARTTASGDEATRASGALPRNVRVRGHGALFYPSIWVGEPPIRSVADILYRRRRSLWAPRKSVLDETYRGHPVAVYEDGFIVVWIEDPATALEYLNQIMAYAWVAGRLETAAIRSAELWAVDVDPENPANMGATHSLSSLRNLPASIDWSPPRYDGLTPILSIEGAKEILRGAEAVGENADLSFALLFLHEAHTSLEESDYRPAFIDAWLVMEQWVNSLWKASLTSRGRSAREIKELENQPNWTVAVMAETLELMGEIDHQRLDELDSWRKLRNRIVHDGHPPTREEAQGVLDLALALFRGRAGDAPS